MEVFYLANKSENLYFCLLGDCSESAKKEENFDKEVIEEGLKQVQNLNKKYKKEIFYFAYRKRKWNEKQNSYLGCERKRGALTEFVEVLLGNLSSKQLQEKYYINTWANCFFFSEKENYSNSQSAKNEPVSTEKNRSKVFNHPRQ